MKMDSKVKVLWLKALRSKKWRKARGRLARSSNYRCCLGVLCEIGPSPRDKSTTSGLLVGGYNTWDGAAGGPDQKTKGWAMLGPQNIFRLMELNDNTVGWDKVIEYIEKNL